MADDKTNGLKVAKRELPLRRNNLYYIEKDGKQLVLHSVTNILGKAIPKPALTGWAAKTAARYAIENPGCTVEQAAASIYTKKDDAADKGKIVHAWAEAYGNGELIEIDSLPEDLQGFGKAFLSFIEKEQPKILHTECTVFNETVGYAGTADQIGYARNGKLTIFDYKTGKGTYYESHLQQEAYANAEYILTKDKKIEKMPKIEEKYLVHLKPNGTYNLIGVSEPFEDFITIKKSFDVLNKQESNGY